jgi:translation initiation factor 3 subunit F
MATTPTLNLNAGKGKLLCKVHPVVIFGILDHFKRRGPNQSRVIGTLLGHVEELGSRTVIHVTNCFPVPHEEDDEQVVLDPNFLTTMFKLHNSVKKEAVVGWYGTGNAITYKSSLIHNAYREQMNGEEPIHLTVDTDLTNDRLGIKAWTADTITVPEIVQDVLERFEAHKVVIDAYDTEKIGVDALINGHPDSEKLDAPSTLLTEYENLAKAKASLLEKLEIVSEYVDKVASGEIEGDADVGRSIATALATVPHMESQPFDAMFTSNVQDLLMVLYLSDITKSQLALSQRISSLG